MIGLRSLRLKQQSQKERAVVEDLEAKIGRFNDDLAKLKAECAAYEGRYSRSSLLCARGRIAVTLYEIACRNVEIAELIDERDRAREQMRSTEKAVMALTQRKQRHCERLAKEKTAYATLRELQLSEEILEGKGYGFSEH
ncbi:hypothetical protein AQ914_04510 [Burkholderia pseudomallei]|nr:hypothetical protein AQ914_04510 [Burkholderia pseudomallei]